MEAKHEMTADGESTARWAFREPGFFGSYKQFCCCARCGSAFIGGPNKKRRFYNAMKPNTYVLCDDCFDQLPE